MSRKENFEIPAQFSFTPFPVKWSLEQVELLGWKEDLDHEHLEWIRRNRLPEFPILEHTVVLGLGGKGGSRTIDLDRSHVPSTILKPSENRKNAPELTGRSFELLCCVHDPEECEKLTSPSAPTKDAWSVRGEFLELEPNMKALSRFLNRAGLWQRVAIEDGAYIPALPLRSRISYDGLKVAVVTSGNYFFDLRDTLRRALAGSPDKWLRNPEFFALRVTEVDTEPPYYKIRAKYALDAIMATITIDHLRGAKFGVCKLHDCGAVFQRTSGQKKLYCNQAHAHLANVRERRRKGIE